MTNEDRFEELSSKQLLDKDEVIEMFMLTMGCCREEAEELYEKFRAEYRPVSIH